MSRPPALKQKPVRSENDKFHGSRLSSLLFSPFVNNVCRDHKPLMRIYENIYIYTRVSIVMTTTGSSGATRTVLSCTSTSYRRVAKHFPKSWRSTETAVAIVYSYNPMHSTLCTSRDRFMSSISVLNLAVFLNSVSVLWCQYDVVRCWNSLDFLCEIDNRVFPKELGKDVAHQSSTFVCSVSEYGSLIGDPHIAVNGPIQRERVQRKFSAYASFI